MLESKKATDSVAREKTDIRGTRAVLQIVFLLHVGALVSTWPSSAPQNMLLLLMTLLQSSSQGDAISLFVFHCA